MFMMLPFEAPTIFEGIHKQYFQMPRVVKDQRNKFENDDLFRQLSHESAVKYTGFKDRPLEERQMKFIANCQEGHTEVSVVQSGIQFTLTFNPMANPAYNNEGCDFEKETGKVHIKSGFILNGVCVLWRGWIDLQRLEGFGCLEYDQYRSYLEEAMLKQQIDKQQQAAACNNTSSSMNAHHHHSAALAAAAAAHHLSATNPLSPFALNPSTYLNGPGLGPIMSPPQQPLPPPPPQPQVQQAPPPPPQAPPQAQAPPPPSSHQAGGNHLQQHQQHPSLTSNHHHQQHQQPPPPPALAPPVSLAESAAAAHYGNAAIAAAAAAAFHQALSAAGAAAGQVPSQPPPSHQALHHPGLVNGAMGMGVLGHAQAASQERAKISVGATCTSRI